MVESRDHQRLGAKEALHMRILPILAVGMALGLAACSRDPGPKGEPGAQGPAGPQGGARRPRCGRCARSGRRTRPAGRTRREGREGRQGRFRDGLFEPFKVTAP